MYIYIIIHANVYILMHIYIFIYICICYLEPVCVIHFNDLSFFKVKSSSFCLLELLVAASGIFLFSYFIFKELDRWQQQWIHLNHSNFLLLDRCKTSSQRFLSIFHRFIRTHTPRSRRSRPLLAVSVDRSFTTVWRNRLLCQESQFESMFVFEWYIFASTAT